MNELPPLRGVRVVVTRAVHQAEELATAFAVAGAEVVRIPLLEVVPPADASPLAAAAADLDAYDAVVFTSANAVAAFLHRVADDARWPPVAAVGPATAAALRAAGVDVAVEAKKPRAAGLVAELTAALPSAARVLLPQADDARPELASGLRSAGCTVVPLVAYCKRLPRAAGAAVERLLAAPPLGWVTFTSPRTVRAFAELVGTVWSARRHELRAISIGPTTSAELRRLGVEPAVEAASPQPDDMVRAVAYSLRNNFLHAPDARRAGKKVQ